MSDEQTLIDRLEAVHSFPTSYTFKVIGENRSTLAADVRKSLTGLVGPSAEIEITERESKGGRHLALTVRTVMQNAQQVLDAYEQLKTLTSVTYIL